MKRYCAGLAVIAVLVSSLSATPVGAAPPTVTPSPGYDARLQEERNARAIQQPVVQPEPVAPVARPVTKRHVKPHQDGVH